MDFAGFGFETAKRARGDRVRRGVRYEATISSVFPSTETDEILFLTLVKRKKRDTETQIIFLGFGFGISRIWVRFRFCYLKWALGFDFETGFIP